MEDVTKPSDEQIYMLATSINTMLHIINTRLSDFKYLLSHPKSVVCYNIFYIYIILYYIIFYFIFLMNNINIFKLILFILILINLLLYIYIYILN